MSLLAKVPEMVGVAQAAQTIYMGGRLLKKANVPKLTAVFECIQATIEELLTIASKTITNDLSDADLLQLADSFTQQAQRITSLTGTRSTPAAEARPEKAMRRSARRRTLGA